jgi:hypothetical protein
MTSRTLLLLFLPLAAFADDPFACVDKDVFDAFVGGTYGPARYSTDLPADAGDLKLPAEFELIGARTAGSSTTVAWKSAKDAGAALASSIAAFEGAGWKEAGAFSPFRGFHSGSGPQFAQLCRASAAESLEITTRERAADTLVLVSRHWLDEWRQCGGQAIPFGRPALDVYLPDLEVPDGAELRQSGSSGGGDEYSTSAVVLTRLDREDLLEHFNEQINTQGWVAESDWAGGTTAGTVWTRRGSNGQLLVGTMRVAEAAEGVFNARFTVISVSPGDYSDGSFSGHMNAT